MAAAAAKLAAEHPKLEVRPVSADYTRLLDLPHDLQGQGFTGFFPGSTIGNFTSRDAHTFLSDVRLWLGADSRFLIGVDLKKPEPVLHAAYNDTAGTTAAFNLNLLRRINREIGADFTLDNFEHEARYDAVEGRIEMHLVSREAQCVTVAGRVFHFAAERDDSHRKLLQIHCRGVSLAGRPRWMVGRGMVDGPGRTLQCTPPDHTLRIVGFLLQFQYLGPRLTERCGGGRVLVGSDPLTL